MFNVYEVAPGTMLLTQNYLLLRRKRTLKKKLKD